MRKFEFTSVRFEDCPNAANVVEKLNTMGEKGWEPVWIHMGDDYFFAYFKREKIDTELLNKCKAIIEDYTNGGE